MTTERHDWHNWSRLSSAQVREVRSPRDTDGVVRAVLEARESAQRLKMVGTGHSFTSIAAPVDVMLRPERLRGVVDIDRTSMTATALAGTPLKEFNAALAAAGLSLHNMGDIAEQTLAGAISTGTHGSGGVAAGLAAQVVALEMVSGTGEVLTLSRESQPDLFDLARVGLGALGVITCITFAVEPLFVLEATEFSTTWDRVVTGLDELVSDAHHSDLYWFPHTDVVQVKQNRRLTCEPAQAQPPTRLAALWEDEILANGLFGLLTALNSRVPTLVAPTNRVAARALSQRHYSDVAHRVFTSPRRVVFKEMEYALPRETAMQALVECRAAMEGGGHRANFPVEIRTAPADAVGLSTASGRETVYLAFHTHRASEHTRYFGAMEEILLAHDGRPHWGKLHTATAPVLAERYDRFEEFLAARDLLDPDRIFANSYLERVLGA